MKLLAAIGFFGIGLSCAGQYCVTGGPSSTIDSNLEWLNLVGSGSSIAYTGCPGLLGVEDQTQQVAMVNVGQAYTVNLQFGTCGNNYNGVGQGWIDWDQSGTFDASESIGTWQGMPPTSASLWNFNVPMSAVSGTTRMRVMHYEGGALPLNPCAGFSWGSVVDFSVFVSNGVNCNGYEGDNLADAIVAPSLPYVDTSSTVICYSSQSQAYPSPDVYYTFVTGSTAAEVTVSLCNSQFDTYLTILDASGNIIWYNDDASCGSQSEISFPVSPLTTYYAVVEGWSNNTGEYIIEISESETLGINLPSSELIEVYPNPVQEQLTFEMPEAGVILLYSAAGKLVRSHAASKGKHEVTVNELSSGLYYVRIEADGIHYQSKFIKQ